MRVDNNILIPELARLVADEKEVRFTPSGVSMRPFIEGDKDRRCHPRASMQRRRTTYVRPSSTHPH